MFGVNASRHSRGWLASVASRIVSDEFGLRGFQAPDTLDEPGAGLGGVKTRSVKLANHNVAASGDPDIDGSLSGARWNAQTITYSFPKNAAFYKYAAGASETNIGFHAFNGGQKWAAKEALSDYAGVSGLSFVQRTETLSSHAQLRFAETNAANTAYTYYPGSSSVKAGDAWFNSSRHWYDAPVKGNYAYFTILHEIGHALGLKHGNESGGFGTLSAAHNSMEYSVMTYASYIRAPVGNGLTNGADSYAQSLMMDDIAAIQHLYGADFSKNAGDTTYQWSPATGQMFINGGAQAAPAGNKIFLTVWDGGGNDTYDFSNYSTNLKIDLNPGAWTTASVTQLANLSADGGHKAAGNIANAKLYHNDTRSLIENAVGGSGDDTITGNQAANALSGGAGSDTFVFKVLNEAADTISDFTPGADSISISLTGFGLALAKGGLATSHFDSSGIATKVGPEFVFDPSAQSLAYDPDGKGPAAGIVIAHLPSVAALYVHDIILF
jgi:serralysin